jgi:uncharacterized membrane protein YvlD (DUF360 family)
MNIFGRIVRSLIRFLVVWFIDTVSLWITAQILPGVSLQPVGNLPVFVVATAAAFVLGIVNFIIRPLLLIITLPLGWIAVLVSGFFINGIVLWITASLMTGFDVDGFWPAFWGGLVLSLVNTVITTIMSIDDEDSFYENLIQRRAVRMAAGKIETGEGRGLVILETDGLSYERIQKAIADGNMPTLKKMIDEEGYKLSCLDCGIPPTTPACQAGILQGNNTNIPAFRWLDKKSGRLLAGGQAAAEVEPILSDGNGLLRGGSSIGNMFSGDAAKSILTFSKIFTGTPEDKKQRAQDMYLLMRNPYFFTRTLILVFTDIILELWQAWQQRRRKEYPRLNRLHNGYPVLRAVVNVFLRDIGTYFTTLDIIRGVPAMYTLYAGFDEVAHHSGPYSNDTKITLRQFDHQVARIKRVIEEKAPRPYEILILSDHGQSFGPTFKQRYNISILDFIQQQLPHDATVAGSGGGDDGSYTVAAMMDEMQNLQDNDQGGRVGKAAIRQAKRMMKSNLDQNIAYQEFKPAKVTVAYGGNGALVYFDLFPRKITLNELNAAYPGMVDSLVQHEGIGFVIAYEDDYTPVAFGKKGARNLHTSVVVGEDPLAPFGQEELRTWQLARMADFDNSGDLILNSTLYPDGTVAALEELIGNHGGLGGEQTNAYLFHPGDMVIPETRGSFEFKALLDSRRGLPGPTPKPPRPEEPQVNPWAFSTLGKGLGQVGTWLENARRAMALHPEAYQRIAKDAYMTAPALLIAFLAQVLISFNSQEGFDVQAVLVGYAWWFVALIILQLTAKLLRGKAKFTPTLRVAGFAQSAHILELLVIVPVIGPAAKFIAVLLSFFGVWIGSATAHQLKGWRTLFLPVVYLAVLVVGFVFLQSVLRGTVFFINGILPQLGWTPGN